MPIYGAKAQYVEAEDLSPPLSISDKKIIGSHGFFLYYAQAVDPTMLAAPVSIVAHQANPTYHTMQKVKQFLDCAAIHPYAILT